MIPIGGKPILWHIMNRYAAFGHNDFILALGYKAQVVKEFFVNYRTLNSDFSINLADGSLTPISTTVPDWRVTLVDTGLDSMTGGRIKRLAPMLSGETFMLTYGDGLADVDINRALDFHKSHGRWVTVCAARPSARFGELEIRNNTVVSFKEKPQLDQGWINGGYFIVEPEFLDLIQGDSTLLEREPLEAAASLGQLMAFKHDGFWQSMDTKREHELLEKIWASGVAPWSR
jgi:glucose-1-phosphate cytidylyltransferase